LPWAVVFRNLRPVPRGVRAGLAVLAFFALGTQPASAQGTGVGIDPSRQGEIDTQLGQLRQQFSEVSSEEADTLARLEYSRQESKRLDDLIATLDSNLTVTAARLDSARKEVVDATTKVVAAEREVQAAHDRLEAAKDALRSSALAAYIGQNSLALVTQALQTDRPALEQAVALRYASIAGGVQKDRIDGIRSAGAAVARLEGESIRLRKQAEARQADVEAEEAKLTSMKAEQEQAKAQMEAEVGKQEDLLAQVQAAKAKYRQEIDALVAESDRIEAELRARAEREAAAARAAEQARQAAEAARRAATSTTRPPATAAPTTRPATPTTAPAAPTTAGSGTATTAPGAGSTSPGSTSPGSTSAASTSPASTSAASTSPSSGTAAPTTTVAGATTTARGSGTPTTISGTVPPATTSSAGPFSTGAPTVSRQLQYPLPGYPIVSTFGMRMDPVLGYVRMHEGIDIWAPAGTPIKAAGAGTVIWVGARGGYGNAVFIDHGGGLVTIYAHQSTIAVSLGQQVAAGAVIGYVGQTGLAGGPHLHLETRVNGVAYDPLKFVPRG